eukprot:gene16900-23190_t
MNLFIFIAFSFIQFKSIVSFALIPNSIVKTSLRSTSVSIEEPALRIGHGFDIHRLTEGKRLVIGGVYIPYKLGADAHSDGDAMYH